MSASNPTHPATCGCSQCDYAAAMERHRPMSTPEPPAPTPLDAFDITAFRLPWWTRAWRYLDYRVRSWWCDRVGHDYEGGSGFNGEYTQHWYQCRRCGDGDSD